MFQVRSIYACAGLVRLTSVHGSVEVMPPIAGDPSTVDQRKARVLIEKKTVINLIEAFGVAVKHYLRGEEGVYYVDLYHLVKYLPAYALPAGLPSLVDVTSLDGASTRSPFRARGDSSAPHPDPEVLQNGVPKSPSATSPTFPHSPLPPPVTSPHGRKVSVQVPQAQRFNVRTKTFDKSEKGDKGSTYSGVTGVGVSEDFLLPARNPPKYHLLDLFPFSLLVGFLTKRGKEVKVCHDALCDLLHTLISGAGQEGSTHSCEASEPGRHAQSPT